MPFFCAPLFSFTLSPILLSVFRFFFREISLLLLLLLLTCYLLHTYTNTRSVLYVCYIFFFVRLVDTIEIAIQFNRYFDVGLSERKKRRTTHEEYIPNKFHAHIGENF